MKTGPPLEAYLKLWRVLITDLQHGKRVKSDIYNCLADEMLEAESRGVAGRVTDLEKRVLEQGDELVCLKATLAEALRRLNLLEGMRLSVQPSSPQIPTTPVRNGMAKETRLRPQTYCAPPNNLQIESRPQSQRSYAGSSLPQRRGVHYQSTGSLHSDSQSSSSVSPIPSPSPRATPLPLPRRTVASPQNSSATSTLHKRWSSTGDFNQANSLPSPQANTKDATYNEEDQTLKMHLRGKQVTLPAPTEVADIYDITKVETAPHQRLKLDWVYGYRGRDCRSNLYFLPTGEMVYFVATVVVLHNIEEPNQRHYLGHTDDVKSLAIHPNKLLVASGQCGGSDPKSNSRPHIRIWNSISLHTQAIIGMNDFTNAVTSISFSKSDGGSLLVAIDDSQDHVISVWEWLKGDQGHKITETKCSVDPIVAVEFHPFERNVIVTCGKSHLAFWTLDVGGALYKKMGIFEAREKPKYVTSIAFLQSGDIITGDSNGNLAIYPRGRNTIGKLFKKCHDGAIFTICVLKDGSIITGGKDGRIRHYDSNMKEYHEEKWIPGHYGGVRVISEGRGSLLLVGTTKNCILAGNNSLGFEPTAVLGHADELWALAGHPTLQQFVTAGYDKIVQMWDSLSHNILWSKDIGEQAHSAAFSPDGSVIAVGCLTGRWMIFDTQTREILCKFMDGEGVVQVIQYSPDGNMVAIGSRDSNIYIYQITDGGIRYSRIGRCSGHSSYITHIDWATDNQTIRSNSADNEVLYWNSVTCRPITQLNAVRDLEWASNTCTISFNTIGIWSETADGADVLTCSRSYNSKLLATGDDFGKVRLYSYPAMQPKQPKNKTDICLNKVKLFCCSKDASYNDDEQTLKMYLRGRPIILAAPSTFAENYDITTIGPKPSKKLRLEWAYGYRGRDCRSNLYVLPNGELVYFIAAVAVLHNVEENSQRHYIGHTEDIKSLALHPNNVLIATGQCAGHNKDTASPHIRIWDSKTLETKTILDGGFINAVECLSFSKSDDGTLLVVVDDSTDHTISVWEWEKHSKITETRCSTEAIVAAEFHPQNENAIVTCGKSHVGFWHLEDGTLNKKMGIFGSHDKPKYVNCLAFLPSGEAITGDSNGNLAIWETGKHTIANFITNVHEGSIFCIYISKDGHVITGGGKDACLKYFNQNMEKLNEEAQLEDNFGGVRTIAQGNDSQLYIGTTRNCILQGPGEFNPIVMGHSDELWALAVDPKSDKFVTAAQDKYVRVWSADSKKMIISKHLEDEAQCAAYRPDSTEIAVGCITGKWYVLNAANLEVLAEFTDGDEPIQGHSSYITHIDWTSDGQNIRTNSEDYELLYWNADTLSQQTHASTVRDYEWASNTCTITFTTAGIWPSDADGTDINACDRSHNSELIASVDDFGKVNLYSYPAIQPQVILYCKRINRKIFILLIILQVLHRHYSGHSSHVTNVAFLHDDRKLITVGGNDTAILQWNVQPKIKLTDICLNNFELFCCSKDISYNDEEQTLKMYLRGRPIILAAPSTFAENYDITAIGPKPSKKLKLEWVYGYRGRDCRSNLYVLPNGELVYFVAAVAVLHNVEENSQRHYIGHTDDIKSLALHPNNVLIATGQCAGHNKDTASPHIRIWDSKTLETKTILDGGFINAVGCLSFSKSDDGSLLVAVDDSNDHTISVWEWEKNSKITETRCSTEAIVAAEFHPQNENFIVTCGKSHVGFWHLEDGTLKKKMGIFGSHDKPKYVNCLAFLPSGEAITGDSNGNLAIWEAGKNTIANFITNVHEGSIFCIYISKDGNVITGGGKDACLKYFDQNMEKLDEEAQLEGNFGGVRTIAEGNDSQLYIGTTRNCILQGPGEFNPIVIGHSDELWALAVDPQSDKFVTAAQDKYVRVWSSESKKMIISKHLEDQAQSAAYSPDSTEIAVGCVTGKWYVLNAENLEVLAEFTDGDEPIQVIQYAPNRNLIAIGSRNNYVYLYEIGEDRAYSKLGKLTGHSSYITHIDWTSDGQNIRTNSGDYELLFWNADTLSQETHSSAMRDYEWASNTCTITFTTAGIWPSDADGTDINACDRSHNSELIASVDDFGKVNLYSYPAIQPQVILYFN
ncbi:wd-40 repeat protein [Holotrichia oblita]|uniref:Wd-40 repeat protein n=1 Tax=Holotrichia oblita TaxID=644536 RepID=A0ACB9T9E0_HOLOL|nr:wd-40 repeat protein [Holotrichia oblita]